MKITMLVNRSGYLESIDEERDSWVYTLLNYLGIDIDILTDYDMPDLVEYLYFKKIEVVDYPSLGAVQILKDNEVVGEWAGPEFNLKQDKETGELYYEVSIETWSVMEENIE